MRRPQDGFTIVEVMAGMFMVLLVVTALSALFVSSNDSSLANQSQISELSVLQQQLEKVRQVVKQQGFSALALSSNPAQPSHSPLPTNTSDPNDFITSWNTTSEAFLVEKNYQNTLECGSAPCVISGSPSTGEPMMAPVTGISGGQLSPVQYIDLATGTSYSSLGSVPSGDSSATVNTYVTQASTAGCNTALGSCSSDVRRLIVAVRLNTPSARTDIGPNKPMYASTVFVNPIPSNQPTQASGLRVLGLIP